MLGPETIVNEHMERLINGKEEQEEEHVSTPQSGRKNQIGVEDQRRHARRNLLPLHRCLFVPAIFKTAHATVQACNLDFCLGE